MNIQKTLEEFFRAYGTRLAINGELWHGVITPQKEADETHLHIRLEELGAAREGTWLLLTSCAAKSITAGARVTADGAAYVVRTADTYWLSGEPLYRYAVLERTTENNKEQI